MGLDPELGSRGAAPLFIPASPVQARMVEAEQPVPAVLPPQALPVDRASGFSSLPAPLSVARRWAPVDFSAPTAKREISTFAIQAPARPDPVVIENSRNDSPLAAPAFNPMFGALSISANRVTARAASFVNESNQSEAGPAELSHDHDQVIGALPISGNLAVARPAATVNAAPVNAYVPQGGNVTLEKTIIEHRVGGVAGLTRAGGLIGGGPLPARPADLATTVGTHATFTGPGLTVNDGTAANPYPSIITVSNLATIPSTGNRVTLTINNFSRPTGRLDDVDMLLIGPTGASLIFFSDVGGNGAGAQNITVTLSDAASSYLSDAGALTSGTFKPTNESTPQDNFAQYGAPAGPYGNPGGATVGAGTATFASQFNGTNPNGQWSLYVMDDAPNAVETAGSIASWSLSIDAASSVPEPSTWLMGAALLGVGAESFRRKLRR